MSTHAVSSFRKHSSNFSETIFVALVIAVAAVTFSIAVSSIGLLLAVGVFLFKSIYDRRWEVERTPLDYFFLAYIIVEIGAAIFSAEKWESFANSKRLLLISLVYLVATYTTSQKKALALIGILAAIGAFFSVVELLEYFRLRPERLFLFQHYMTAGGIKMIILLLILPFILHESTPKTFRLFGTFTTIPILIALVLTFTRSSWLGFIGGGVVIGILKNKIVLPILLVAVVLFLLFAPAPLRDRAYSIIDPTHKYNVGRMHMWTTGLKIFNDHPIIGVGDIDLQRIYARYKSPDDIEPGGHLHNNILMWLVTLGIVGCVVLVALFVKIFLVELQIWKRTRHHWIAGSLALGAIAVMVGFHINGLFEWNFGDQEIMILLWTSVGLSLAAKRYVSELPNSL